MTQGTGNFPRSGADQALVVSPEIASNMIFGNKRGNIGMASLALHRNIPLLMTIHALRHRRQGGRHDCFDRIDPDMAGGAFNLLLISMKCMGEDEFPVRLRRRLNIAAVGMTK